MNNAINSTENRVDPTIEKLTNSLGLPLLKAMWVKSISEKHAIWIGNQLKKKPSLFKKGAKNLKRIIEWKKKNPAVDLKEYDYAEILKRVNDNGATTFFTDFSSLQNERIVAICGKGEYKWVSLLSVEDCVEEGRYMHHCLQDSSRNYLGNGARLFSLRDIYNRPVLTLQIRGGEIPEYRAPHDEVPDQKYAKCFESLEKYLKKQGVKVKPLAKYEHSIVTKLKPSELTHKGDLYLDDDFTLENGLPDGLKVTGTLGIYIEGIELPKKLKVGGNLVIGSSSEICHIPNGTKIGKNLIIDTSSCINMDINLKKIKLKGKVILES